MSRPLEEKKKKDSLASPYSVYYMIVFLVFFWKVTELKKHLFPLDRLGLKAEN